jgi:apurinic endonuclease APN1
MKIGFHLSISNGFIHTFNESLRLNCDIIQIFVKNPRSWAEKKWKKEDIASFQMLFKDIPVFAHLSYLPNLARIDEDERHFRCFLHEVELCNVLGINSLVVHCGSNQDIEKGIIEIASAVNRVHEVKEIDILLENSSGHGNGIGKTIAELGKIFNKTIHKKKVFLCLDTAHLFQAGYDIRKKSTWNRILQEIKALFGEDKIALFHLNDSKTGLGTKVDRHWHIGKGEIGLQAFRIISNHICLNKIPGIMETPKLNKMDEENMRVMRSLFSPLMSRSSS